MGDLSITALYTSQAWVWGGFPCAELLATPDGKRVFDATNAALWLARSEARGHSPLRQALVHRHAMIDRLLRESGATQVLELAAGLSQRGAAVSADPRIAYTELDLAPVADKKRALLARTDAGRAVLARPNWRIEGADVATALLADWVTPGPRFVIAEGLLMYLDAAAQRALFAKLAALGDVTFVFDLVPVSEQPAPGLAGRALGRAMRAFTGGKGFTRDPRTRADLLAELRAAGFARATVTAAIDVARDWDLPHPEARTDTLVFTAYRP
ncbi:MAG TPA: class I SAM-dependent methyltransferase [Kofleriaceae bacterium]